MKKIIGTVLAFFVVISLAAPCFAAEATEASGVDVRVNGSIIAFPDAQPYIDENDRTLIPVRFVAEELGADVSWNNDEQIAIIEQDGIRIEVPIGNKAITVTENGQARTVQMDTKAVLSEDRTYVPIRFVAESLGAWVGYSDLFNTVQIYRDVLTPEEITRLHSYYDMSNSEYDASVGATGGMSDSMIEMMRPYVKYFANEYGFENANEFKLRNPLKQSERYFGKTTGLIYVPNEQPDEDYAKLVLAEAFSLARDMTKTGKLTATLKTDISCVYQARSSSSKDTIISYVRGILTVEVPNNADISWIKEKYGSIILNPKSGETYNIDVQIKVLTRPFSGIFWDYVSLCKEA